MDISVIVPIYKGQKYISIIQRMITQNLDYAENQGHSMAVELIFVNDYPDDAIHVKKTDNRYDVIVVENDKNSGIHQTRVNGLARANGDYILFLDQDDKISSNCLYSQFISIGEADVVVGNGKRFLAGEYRKIYRSEIKHKLVKSERIFLKAADQIVSPGHCLIRKESIPLEWKQHIIVKNGGDDMFLWILMFERGCEFAINRKIVYKHVDTGVNVSNDIAGMLMSAENVIQEAQNCRSIRKKTISQYKRRIEFLKKMNSNKGKLKKMITLLTYADICFYKVIAFYA